MDTEFYGHYGPYGTHEPAAFNAFDITFYFSGNSITLPNVEYRDMKQMEAEIDKGRIFGVKVSSGEHYRINPAQVQLVVFKERVENQEAH